VLYGSEKDSMTQTQRSGCPHYKMKVVFPALRELNTPTAISYQSGLTIRTVVWLRTEKDLNL